MISINFHNFLQIVEINQVCCENAIRKIIDFRKNTAECGVYQIFYLNCRIKYMS